MDDLAARKAQLIAQSELDRMRLSHALLTTRRSLSPAALLSSGGAGMRSFAGEALAFGLPLFARRSGGLAHRRVRAGRHPHHPPVHAPLSWRGAAHHPSSRHSASTRAFTSASIAIGRPHSRVVSPGHLFVASMPILLPSPETGEAKSR